MIFGFWKNKPQQLQKPVSSRQRSTAKFGGMQERVIQARLEILLDAVVTRKRSVIEPARALSQFSLVEQEKFLATVDRIALIDQEFAIQFCYRAIPALSKLDDTSWEPWIDRLLLTFRTSGIDAGTASINAYHSYQQEQLPVTGSITFAEVARVLEIYIQALNGRPLKLASSRESYTDTETLFLPPLINHFKTREQNFRLYKALLIHQWAQTRFGTWSIDLAESLNQFPDTDRALNMFHCLETVRLDACIQHELPGVSREMSILRYDNHVTDPQWLNARLELMKPDANVYTSIACLRRLYPLQLELKDALYQGELRIAETADVIAERNAREQSALQEKLAELYKKMNGQATQETSTDKTGFSIKRLEYNGTSAPAENILQYNGTSIETTPELQSLIDSISQDYYQVPEYYFDNISTVEDTTDTVTDNILSNTTPTDTASYYYDEWDHSRQRYRKDWCQLHEEDVQPVTGSFISDTLRKHQTLLKKLHRSFEALRQENYQVKREPFGDEIDVDAAVEAWADAHNGLEASDRLFIQNRREDRNVAVMFMIDMSASTTGWINRVERESLVLLCEVLEILGDRYAIYGFSGHGNKHCQAYRIKHFNECYNDKVKERIEGILPHDYTRLGTAIRHLGYKLNQAEASTRILITISDGRPDDVNGYRGRYGIEDTRKALNEMRYLGIHPYCITVDSNAREYMPHMFGKNDFIIINQVENLPHQIADIYRKLTK